MIGVWKLVSRIHIPIPKTLSITQSSTVIRFRKFLHKLMNFMGVKDEGWKRIIIVIFPIYFILYMSWLDAETSLTNDVWSFLLAVAITIFIWVFGIKIITKIITWISEGFKKN